MCIFIASVPKAKTVVKGYKVAVKDKYNHYYSPFTGIRYEVGKVKVAIKYGKYSLVKKLHYQDILNPENHFNKSIYAGMTAAFRNKEDASLFINEFYSDINDFNRCAFVSPINPKLVILEMKLAGKMYCGSYILHNSTAEVYIGSEIVSIKKNK